MSNATPSPARALSTPSADYLAAKAALPPGPDVDRPERELTALRVAKAEGHGGPRWLRLKVTRPAHPDIAVDEACDKARDHIIGAGLWGELSADVLATIRKEGRKAARKRAKKGRG